MITLNLYICENCTYVNECENEGRQRIRLTTGVDVIATCKCQKQGQYDWFGNKLCPVDKTEVTVIVPKPVLKRDCFSFKNDLRIFLEDIGFKEVREPHSGFGEIFINGVSIGKGKFVWNTDII